MIKINKYNIGLSIALKNMASMALLSAFLKSLSPVNINNLYVNQKSLLLQWKKLRQELRV